MFRSSFVIPFRKCHFNLPFCGRIETLCILTILVFSSYMTIISQPGFKRRPPYNAEAEPYKGDKKVTLETMAALFTANPVCRPTFQEGSNQAVGYPVLCDMR